MTTSETKTKKPARSVIHSVTGKSKILTKKKEAKKVKKIVSPKKEKKPARPSGEEDKVVLRIRVRAYESKILDSSVKQIIDTAMRYDAEIVGPVPLPTEIKKYTVNRASFKKKKKIRVHKRLIDIINPNAKTVEALTNLSLPSGVDIDVKML